MTTPFPFTSGQTLTAAQMNDITNLPINDQTASYTLLVGDAGKRVVMNVASANTVTVNNSVFTAGDTIQIVNKGAGVSTVTAGAGVTINTSDSLALAQYQSGQLVALSASSFLFFPTTETVSAGGLVYLTGAAFTTQTSVSLPANTFSSTYRNYRVMFQITAVTSDADFTLRMRASGTDDSSSQYDFGFVGIGAAAGATSNSTNQLATSFAVGESDATAVRYALTLDVIAPQVAAVTHIQGFYNFVNKANTDWISRMGNGVFRLTTQFDSLTFISSVASSITGIYRVYGYADS